MLIIDNYILETSFMNVSKRVCKENPRVQHIVYGRFEIPHETTFAQERFGHRFTMCKM